MEKNITEDENDYYYYLGNDTEEVHPNFTRVMEFLHLYYVPVVIVVGVLANLVSFVVFVLTHLNRQSLSVYLAALALADSGFLCALFVGWLDYVGIPLFHTYGWCQSTIFASYVCSFLSAWLVVSFTVERYIAICYPLRRLEMCTVRRAAAVVICLALFAVVFYSPTFQVAEVVTLGRFTVCQSRTKYNFLYRGLTYADCLAAFVLPFCAVLFFNVHMVIRLARSPPVAIRISLRYASRDCLRTRAQVHLTKFLLIVSSLFLITNLPTYVFKIIAFVNNTMALAISKQDVLLQELAQFLYYMNFSINFFIYSIGSKNFREALRRLVRRIIRRQTA